MHSAIILSTMFRTVHRSLALFIFALLAQPASPAELKGVNMPDEIQVGEQKLVLNGMGARQYLFVNVYIAGLYLPSKNKSADAIINSTDTRQVEMQFKRAVEQEKLREVWRTALEKNASKEEWPTLKPLSEEFLKIVPGVAENDRLTVLFNKDQVEISLNQKSLGRSHSARFGQVLLATWIGKFPATTALKDGLLGIH
jgi:hypothetical protein